MASTSQRVTVEGTLALRAMVRKTRNLTPENQSGSFSVVHLLIILFLLVAFTGVFYVGYKRVQPLRYRAAIRTWLLVFYAEVVFLLPWPAGTLRLPGLPSLDKYGGVIYLMIFTTDGNALIPGLLRGHRPEERLMLLLLSVPALLVLWAQYRRLTHPPVLPPPPSPPRPWVVPTLFVGFFAFLLALLWWLHNG